MTEEPGDDQIYFSISESEKNLPEYLTDNSQCITDSSQDSTVSPINISISFISTEFVTESLCGSISKENDLILPLNTDTPQLYDNSAVPSIQSNCNTLQLINFVDKSNNRENRSTTYCNEK